MLCLGLKASKKCLISKVGVLKEASNSKNIICQSMTNLQRITNAFSSHNHSPKHNYIINPIAHVNLHGFMANIYIY